MADKIPPEIWLFPYLPPCDRITFGPWEIFFHKGLAEDDVAETNVLDGVAGLIDLYDANGDLGAVVKHEGGKVGEPIDRTLMKPLEQTVTVALLDANPRMDADDESNLSGHQAATSDNAVLFGHGLHPDKWVAVQYGHIVRTLAGGIRIGEAGVKIHRPAELFRPLIGPTLDPEYLEALWSCLSAQNEDARRLGLAIEWLALAWRNTTSITDHLRIMSLYAGFEALLLGGDGQSNIKDLRAAYEQLVGQPRATRRDRRLYTLKGKHCVVPLTEDEHWLTQLARLRNGIAHGKEIGWRDYFFDHTHQWVLAERNLRSAIKSKVIELTGDGLLTYPPGIERESARLYRRL